LITLLVVAPGATRTLASKTQGHTHNLEFGSTKAVCAKNVQARAVEKSITTKTTSWLLRRAPREYVRIVMMEVRQAAAERY
jgi:hypothetical protein